MADHASSDPPRHGIKTMVLQPLDDEAKPAADALSSNDSTQAAGELSSVDSTQAADELPAIATLSAHKID